MRTELYTFYLKGRKHLIGLSRSINPRQASTRVAESCFGQEPNTMQTGTKYDEPWPTGQHKQEPSAMNLGQDQTMILC